jgi:hypothetical protein
MEAVEAGEFKKFVMAIGEPLGRKAGALSSSRTITRLM